MNFRDLVEVFPMMADRGDILANVSERMEERSFVYNEETRQETRKDYPIESNKTRQNRDDVFRKRRNDEHGIALSDRQSFMRTIRMYVSFAPFFPMSKT